MTDAVKPHCKGCRHFYEVSGAFSVGRAAWCKNPRLTRFDRVEGSYSPCLINPSGMPSEHQSVLNECDSKKLFEAKPSFKSFWERFGL